MSLYTIKNEDPESAGHGRVYVGSCTIPIRSRMARHYHLAEHATETSPALYRDMHASLERARASRKYMGYNTTEILRLLYPTSVTARESDSLKTSEQSLLDELQDLSLNPDSLPCYNMRRPVSETVTEVDRAIRKASYHASKVKCSCGRLVSKGNRTHLGTAVHKRG